VRLSQPRITPLTTEELSAEQAEVLAPLLDGGGSLLNIYATLARHPKALAGFLHWGRYILSRRNTLPARERELVILRTGFDCKCGYEWAQHVRIGQRVGLTEEEVARIKAGPDAEGWTPAESALLRAADDLVGTHAVSDATWQALSEYFDEQQRMDVVFTVGEYTQVSMFLNAFGVQLEPDLTADPDLAG
jgi:4-carboxymuconolactone decarboxylase